MRLAFFHFKEDLFIFILKIIQFNINTFKIKNHGIKTIRKKTSKN